jgi:D-serine deaminase-like pyridoxal phosphate-dependent protein
MSAQDLFQRAREAVGKPVEDVETPALIVEVDIMLSNMDKMMGFLRDAGAGVGIRPHAKSHKTPQIARLQMDRGALGICCAKLGEAEAMVDGGVPDIMITSQVVGGGKIRRLADPSKRVNLKVAVDTRENVEDISRETAGAGGNVGIVIETEVGMNRCGVRTHDEAVGIARAASTLPGVWYAGIMGYEGHAVFMPDFEERKTAANLAYDKLLGFRDAVKAQAGLDSAIVSTGGTGTYLFGGRRRGMTDIEAGSYIFMDTRYGSTAGIDFLNSLAVVSTVISHPQPDLYVCDAGIKSMTEEFGLVSTLPSYGLKVTGMSEEHVKLRPEATPDNLPGFKALDEKYGARAGKAVGDKILLIPSHCCSTVNLHDVIYAVRDGMVEDVWRVTGRGRFA